MTNYQAAHKLGVRHARVSKEQLLGKKKSELTHTRLEDIQIPLVPEEEISLNTLGYSGETLKMPHIRSKAKLFLGER